MHAVTPCLLCGSGWWEAPGRLVGGPRPGGGGGPAGAEGRRAEHCVVKALPLRGAVARCMGCVVPCFGPTVSHWFTLHVMHMAQSHVAWCMWCRLPLAALAPLPPPHAVTTTCSLLWLYVLLY